MTDRRRPRRREIALAFEALSIEGGLLSPEWLARVAQLHADAQSAPDYRIPKGLNLRDEIGRYWRIAQAHWAEFAAGRAAGASPSALAERFVLGLLRESFGFTLTQTSPIEIAGRTYPIGFHALGGRVPVVIAAADSGLDAPSLAFGDAGRRRSAFGLAQEFLNANENALWGLCSDGLTLRILRDNGSLTRPAWIEADLGRIFAEERYADFAALWLLSHETRFGSPDLSKAPSECALEVWRAKGREEGTRAHERLRLGVKDALVALGQGFLAHPENQGLRAALHAGSLTPKSYFQQLLRAVYRIIFLLTAEERDVLHPLAASKQAKALYAEGYSLRRLRDRSVRHRAHDRFGDLWEGLRIVLRGMARGEPRLGLPALGGLFADDQCPELDAAKLENRALLMAIFRLSWLREDTGLVRVNWRDMGPEEFGSVYEGLLELVPQVTQGGRSFAFATGGETKDNARKLSGSYYTPEDLVKVLLDTALEPVIKATIAENPVRPVEALLDLAIVDPACGSGHFLLAAARRLAGHVARLQATGTPSAAEYRHAVRRVVGRCLFGVDLNPMAVELCKVSLWMEAVEPGRPLSFLNSHIRHGNALLGATPELLAKGVPDEAWDPIEGDDKKTASALKKQNKKERSELTLDFGAPPASTYARIGEGARAVDEAADEELSEVLQKERRWAELLASTPYDHQRFVADMWCSAFVWRKEPGVLRDMAPTEGVFRAHQKDGSRVPAALRKEVERLLEAYHFFHWHLAFPQVFGRGGFDVVLGNPPWERVKLQEQEFFASRSEVIANAPNAAARKKLIAALPHADPSLWEEWSAATRVAQGQSHFVRQSGRYPLCGTGDINTYALFAEHNRAILSSRGRAGFIVPTGIATDDTTKDYFRDLMSRKNLAAFYGFENEAKLFRWIDHRVNFCLLVLSIPPVVAPSFSAFARDPSVLNDPNRVYQLTEADIALLNPNTRTCPVFRTRRDADINLALYRRAGVLWREDDPDGNPWGMRFMAMFHMANDSGLFRTRAELEAAGWTREGNQYRLDKRRMLPLIEAKMVYLLNHRFGDFALLDPGDREHILPQVPDEKLARPDYLTTPRYWVAEHEVSARLAGAWDRGWLLGWRDVTDARSSVRTVVASLIPRVATGDTFLLAMPSVDSRHVSGLYANLCSFALDYAARQKVGGTHLKYHVFKQLPVLAPAAYTTPAPWEHKKSIRDWLLPRVLELTFTAWDIEPFARDCDYNGPPFRWDRDRRFLLRAELDAAFFHLYGLPRADADYILDTFPIVQKNDEKAHGEYRTKRVILEIFDTLAEAARSQIPYRSPVVTPG
ncbi:MAG: N-6 DNA methylase [Polyangiaceae bacterium]|nr:N-6 DNA methylase [Polyangiaceae bacterium]